MRFYRFIFPIMMVLCLILSGACVPVEKSRSDTEQAKYHYLMGLTSLREGNPTEALKELLQAVEYDDTDPQIHAALYDAYIQKQAFDLAEKHIKRAIDLSEGDPRYYNNLGALYLSLERYDDAIASFKVAADNLLFERPDMAWTGIGVAYFQKQDYPAAQRAYEKAISLNPLYFMPVYRLGELFYTQDRPAEALQMFSKTVELEPRFPDGHYWQGLVYMKMKETAKAKQAFLDVIRLAPQSNAAKLASDYLKIIDE